MLEGSTASRGILFYCLATASLAQTGARLPWACPLFPMAEFCRVLSGPP